MDRTAVAAYYRGKGYLVHDGIVVTGQSGNQSRIPLLCEGPLGNLAVFFGDAGGIDGHEIGAAKRVARDLGATAVVAAGAFTSEQRLTAADLGVVLVDDSILSQPPPPPRAPSTWPGGSPKAVLESDLAAHPWPASGRPEGRDVAAVALTDIDQVLGHREASPAPVAVAPATAPAKAATARSADGGLWKSPALASAAPAPVAASKPAAFSWLALPPAPAQPAEVEVTSALQARAAAVPRTAEQVAADLHLQQLRKAQLRVLVRRGAWILGGAVALYLFLLWWL